VREGEIVDQKIDDPLVKGSSRFFESLAREQRVTATAVQTVSGKKYDGFALLLVKD
jgi:hypothetical protein